MRRTQKRVWIVLALGVGAAVGCSAALDQPTQQDVEWASARWPETSLADLQHGRELYVEKCAGCHNLPLPAKYSPREWEGYVAYMTADAKLKPGEPEAIVRFLTAASARARGEGPASGAATPTNQ